MSNEVKTAEVLRTEIDESILDIAKLAKEHIEISDVGAVTINKELIDETLAARELDRESLVKYQNYTTDLAAGVQVAVGEKAVEFFKGNASVNEVAGGCKIGIMDLDALAKRTQEVRNVQTGETSVRHGATKVQVLFRKQQAKAKVKRVNAYINQLAEDELS